MKYPRNTRNQKEKLSLEKISITKLDNRAKRSIFGGGVTGVGGEGDDTKGGDD